MSAGGVGGAADRESADLVSLIAAILKDAWVPSHVVYGTDEPVGFDSLDDWARHVSSVLVDRLELREERAAYAEYETKTVSGGEGAMAYGGQLSRYLGMKTQRRWVSGWEVVGG